MISGDAICRVRETHRHQYVLVRCTHPTDCVADRRTPSVDLNLPDSTVFYVLPEGERS